MEQKMRRNSRFPYLCLSPPQYHDHHLPISPADYSTFFSQAGSLTPSSASVDDIDQELTASATDDRLYLAGLALQRQDFARRYELCLSHLHDATDEAETLRLENAHLRVANADIARRLRHLHLAGKPKIKDGMASALAEELRRLRLASIHPPPLPEIISSPRRVLEERSRVSLPKSISVRSDGYRKLSPEAVVNRNGVRIRVSGPVLDGSQQQQQQQPMLVGLGSGSRRKEKENEEEEEMTSAALELEVYNQGMFKTELCNKWRQESRGGGKGCPYGSNCQFAHGIAELRPVIRHPRYKTEICRILLAGDTCPYGHRCHFRHALSPLRPTL